MTNTELAQTCANAINSGSNPPLVILVIKGHRKTFAGKGSPRGQVLDERKDENVIAFNAIDLLAYMISKGQLSHPALPPML